jgi:hypothetical protein
MRASGIAGAGEGLFTTRPLHEGELVSLLNGERSAPTLDQDWSDYRVKLDGDTDLDIPEVFCMLYFEQVLPLPRT